MAVDQDVVGAGLITLKKINGKVNPADLLTKPKSAAEAVRLSSALGYELVLRKGRVKGGETFTGFVKRLLRGDKRDEGDQLETFTWWIDRYKGNWGHGGASYRTRGGERSVAGSSTG